MLRDIKRGAYTEVRVHDEQIYVAGTAQADGAPVWHLTGERRVMLTLRSPRHFTPAPDVSIERLVESALRNQRRPDNG